MNGSWKFLIVVLATYATVLAISKQVFLNSITFFIEILYKILPIFILVFILMVVTNYYITPKFVLKHLKGKGSKKWIFVIIGGILSTGPIYMWYPLLAELRQKGLSYGLIACFLYNRAIKIPLLPVAVFYFGWTFVIVLSLVMVAMSIIQGLLIDEVKI